MISGARALAYALRALSRLAGRMAVASWRTAEYLESRRPGLGRFAVRFALVAAAAAVLAAGREDA